MEKICCSIDVMKQYIHISVSPLALTSLYFKSGIVSERPCNILPDQIVLNHLLVLTLLWCCTNVQHFTHREKTMLSFSVSPEQSHNWLQLNTNLYTDYAAVWNVWNKSMMITINSSLTVGCVDDPSDKYLWAATWCAEEDWSAL